MKEKIQRLEKVLANTPLKGNNTLRLNLIGEDYCIDLEVDNDDVIEKIVNGMLKTFDK